MSDSSKLDYWIEVAEYDLETAKAMLETKRYLYRGIIMDKKQVIDLVKKYASLIIERFNVEQIILYGSYAKGTYHEESDIDVAVVMKEGSVSTNVLDDMTELYKLRREVSPDIEPLLFIEGQDRSGFLEDIMSYGEIIYQN